VTSATAPVRLATASDADQLIRLWDLLFEEPPDELSGTWTRHARAWFDGAVRETSHARFPVIEVNGAIVATAIGTLEIGVPNPQCPRGRVVRLANVITLPQHRNRGFGTAVVRDVVAWARSINADRVDLSATVEGQHIYEQLGFVLTKAPRMKFVL
jgi:GNAT superfamily N-acetyltransferase